MTSIAEAARGVLLCAEPREKAMAARRVVRQWRHGRLTADFDCPMPDRPAWPARPELKPPAEMPRRGRAGSLRSRQAMIHALAHIEFAAIDLAFDLVGRFGRHFPRAFVDDWLRVGAEEAMHFALLSRRLEATGLAYGDLPAHAGLWDAASATRHDPAARLAIVPMVLEARGLDVTPQTIARFEQAGDERSAAILKRIVADEIRHVGFGVKWFNFCCDSADLDRKSHWQDLVRAHFNGQLKAPFNDSAREQAGLTREYYRELAPERFP